MKKNLKLLLAALISLGLMGVASACDFIIPDTSSDSGLQSESPAVEYTVTFVADGVTVDTVTYTEGAESITEPAVPAKEHYTGAWEAYTLDGNVTVNAVYTLMEYTVTFVADGKTVAVENYTIEDTEITQPTAPAKDHYTVAWEAYELTGGNVTVNAVYTAIEYTVTFVVEGTTVGTQTYTVEDETITEPAVSAKDHYAGAWETYALDGGNKTVNAVYTPIEYKITFVADGTTVKEVSYTVETESIEAPAVPEKTGYKGTWAAYELDGGDKTVNASYEANTYQITYDAKGGSVEIENQEVIYGEAYTLATATASKFYQEFLGWVDENGNYVVSGEAWTITSDVTLTAKYSNVITFDSMTEVPSYFQNGGRATLSIVDGNGGKVLQATSENNDQGNVRIMMTVADLAQFFEDPSVQYMAFDLKLPEGATTPVSSIMYHNLEQTNYTSYETGDPSKSGSQFDTTPTDAFKSYYLPRSVYEAWVANGKTEARILNVQAGITQGASYWVDNFRPVTEVDYTADLFSFETGSLRKNMDDGPGFCTPNYNQFHFKITGADASTAKFTNEIVSDGMRAIQFTKKSGESVMMFNPNSDPSMEVGMREAGYVSFDLYVPEGSDAKIKHHNQAWYGALKQGWNTIYEKVDATNNELIRFVDTTASTYVIDNFRLLTEDEYNAAKFGFEAGGVLRDNNANDDTASGWTYYYAGWDKANNKASIQVTEGDSLAVLSNVRFATEQVHGGDYSLAFDKKAGWMDLKMASESEMYELLKGGFTFWIYSTTALNGTSSTQIANGYEGKLHGGEGIDIEANTWTKITIMPDDIKSASRFLTLTGSTEGTIYIDDFQALSETDAE
ncbi:MAG: hypothetical protein E7349_00465 [Clostridiales bacterium]|nr:hypothetical protein [Clostridiales bacterium]